eukprot:scaffold175911_cov31-Tisochrysis_lutea.AAC.2
MNKHGLLLDELGLTSGALRLSAWCVLWPCVTKWSISSATGLIEPLVQKWLKPLCRELPSLAEVCNPPSQHMPPLQLALSIIADCGLRILGGAHHIDYSHAGHAFD